MNNQPIEVVRVVNKNPEQNLIKNNPELKLYLLCITGKDGANDSWELITGRTELYETIKSSIEFIDLSSSFVLVSTSTLDKRKSIVAFMKYAAQFYNDSFDIEDYIKGDWSEDEYNIDNDIDPMFKNNSIGMREFMNGNINTIDLE